MPRLGKEEEEYLAKDPIFTSDDELLSHGTFVAYVFYLSSFDKI